MTDTHQAMQSAMQPWLKLAQANMELLTQFSTSREVLSQSMVNAQNLMEQGQKSAANLSQSNAFAQLAQGFMKNCTEFMTDVSQAGMAALGQGQAALMQRAQEAGDQVMEATANASKKRSR